MTILAFIKDMPVYKHGENEPFKVDITEGKQYTIDDIKSSLLVFGYTDWMSGSLVMNVQSIVDDGFAVIIEK